MALSILCLLVTDACEIIGDVFGIRGLRDDTIIHFLEEAKKKKDD